MGSRKFATDSRKFRAEFARIREGRDSLQPCSAPQKLRRNAGTTRTAGTAGTARELRGTAHNCAAKFGGVCTAVNSGAVLALL
eukprot:1438290-Prymnesium_polylepis.1